MALPELATAADLEAYGYPESAASLLARASTRVRRHTKQRITAGTTTDLRLPSPFLLPQRPVREVTAVTVDGVEIQYEMGAYGQIKPMDCTDGPLLVTYDHGYEELPDELVELVCSIAARMATTPNSVGAGARTEQAGGESVTYGSDAYAGTTGLVPEEKKELDRMFPKPPRTIFLSA